VSIQAVQPDRIISSILRHDRKQNSYKIALPRAINDAVLSYPDMLAHERDIAIPRRVLARYWVAYYWPFADASAPIYQGQRRSKPAVGRAEDMEFRPSLAALRTEWEAVIGQAPRASDGFAVIGDMMIDRKRASYPRSFLDAYARTLARIEQALKQPIQYAGEGNWVRSVKPRVTTGSEATLSAYQVHNRPICVSWSRVSSGGRSPRSRCGSRPSACTSGACTASESFNRQARRWTEVMSTGCSRIGRTIVGRSPGSAIASTCFCWKAYF
jgi:hypothetical protein